MRLLLILLLLPICVFAQSAKTTEMWLEQDVYKHMINFITETKGGLNDTCKLNILPTVKDIYIIKTDYIKTLPDSANGYHIHYINADSNHKMLYKLQKEQHVPVYYFAKWYHFLEFYQYWLMPVTVKKKKLQYENTATKFFYYYRQDLSRFEYTKTECISW